MESIKEPFQLIRLPVKSKWELIDREAAILVEIANLFKNTSLTISKNKVKVDAKSIISILHLSCQIGDNLIIEAKGAEAELAAASLAEALSEPKKGIFKDILSKISQKTLV